MQNRTKIFFFFFIFFSCQPPQIWHHHTLIWRVLLHLANWLNASLYFYFFYSFCSILGGFCTQLTKAVSAAVAAVSIALHPFQLLRHLI